MTCLNDQVLQAHAREDTPELIRLYALAAQTASSEDEEGFFLTHAYVFALETADKRTSDLRRRLVQMGREADPEDHAAV